ncbi:MULTISPECIES: efflux RND transporter periplasmic adaptor subunit [Pseudomonas]|uniref:efflux RND transporter periplasmic adaptor subunit n=1 Tax=Pseudomonas TaxID=286 RepID=UPI0013A7733C|nr:efflux RND transporter periplasmic adaptor subunit [Pseudomonas sp. OIL-1]QIB52586.1 efflux RND transporter periplasmic adaptor subunit [Pseudomonas sp. OIL-1]
MSKPIGAWKQLFLLIACSLSLPLLAQQEPLAVAVAEVRQWEMANQIEALGTLRASETADITADITETVSAIHFDDGQRVDKGELLVSLTNSEQQAQLNEARATLADAERQLERTRGLVERRVLPQQELENWTRDRDIARAQLQAVEARLADRQIRAPFDSVVGLRQISVGTLLTPGTLVARLHDDSQMKLDFSIPEIKLSQVAPGRTVIATTRAFPDASFRGEVTALDNEVDPATRSVEVRASLPNPEGVLRPGMLMSVRLRGATREALVIPEEALLPLGSRQFVMLVNEKDGQLITERREVVIGTREPGIVEVEEGLEAGQRVVTHGNFRVQSGQPIRIIAEQQPGESTESVLSDDAP